MRPTKKLARVGSSSSNFSLAARFRVGTAQKCRAAGYRSPGLRNFSSTLFSLILCLLHKVVFILRTILYTIVP